MTNQTETSHAKIVANFGKLIEVTASWGEAYSPSKETIKQPALIALATAAGNSLRQVNALLPAYTNAVAARSAAFEPLDKLVTRALNSLRSTDTTEQVDNSARTLARKIQGTRASSILTDEEKKQLTEAGKSATQISSSQQSFDNRLDNFNKLIVLLQSVPQYAPNEEDLKVTSLRAYYETLKAAHLAVNPTAIALNNARIARNEVLYKPLSGMMDLALDVKAYAKSIYGATDPHYKQLASLDFHPVKP